MRNEKVDSIISNWDLEDMEDGWFLRRLRAIKPKIPTIVFIRSGNLAQEIKARSLGVSAVLTDEASDELFRETVAGILGLKEIVGIKAISSAENRERRYRKERIKG